MAAPKASKPKLVLFYKTLRTSLLFFSLFFSASFVLADDLSSTSYKMQFTNLNIGSGTGTSSSYKATTTEGQTAAGQFGTTNNLVKSGFQYIYPFQKFSFKVAPQSINFGSLIVGSFSTATQTLEITTKGAGGYNVTVSEDHPLYLRSNILADGDMEQTNTTAWVANNSASLAKQTTNVHGGRQVIRITSGGVANPSASQNVLDLTKSFHVTGFARSDGNAVPKIYLGNTNNIWTGTTSTTWQAFDVTGIPTGNTLFYLFTPSAVGGQYVEFDDVVVTQVGIIPDTLCDTTCSETTAATWTNAANPGFGYYITGDDVVAGFTNSTYYKQFANLAVGEIPQVVMHSTEVGVKRHGVLTYKIAVKANQAAGSYQTQITYIAIPGY